MSLLLEALKKAALEKQSKHEEETLSPDQSANFEPSLGDTLDQTNDVEPAAEEMLIEETSISDTLDTIDTLIPGESNPDDEFSDSGFQIESLDLEDSATPLDEAEDLLFEPEFEEPELTESESEFEFQEEPDPQEIENEIGNIDFVKTDASEPQQEIGLIDHKEIEAAREKLEQEQALEEQRLLLEQERIRQEQEEEQEEEKEQLRQQELEQKRQEEEAKKELQRQTETNREALDHLITSGKNINKKSKRRSVFLYALLIFTALGGLSAYYIFLIANTEKNELRSNIVSAPNDDITDVAEMLQSEGVLDQPSNQLDDNLTLTSQTVGTVLEESGTPSTTNASTSGTLQGAPLEGQVGEMDMRSDPAAISQRRAVAVATRIDPPPSASAYLQPLILSSTGDAQRETLSERVIIHHKSKQAGISDLISRAYEALQTDQIAQADQLYRLALAENPEQRDALLGAAATSTSLGNYEDAISLYRQRLSIDPSDTYARAGLLALASNASTRDEVSQEVDAMLRDNPDSAHLHFLKGVGLAAELDWQNAQTAFYDAYRLSNDNPDYAYNLAISLDHLNQSGLARAYYERALALSVTRKPNFDLAAAQQRISELTRP